MAHAGSLNTPVLALLPQSLDGLRILDCAIGLGLWGHMIRIHKDGWPHLVGNDIWEPHITKQKALGIYDELYVCDVRDLPFPDRSFDIVLACEVLEHLDHDDGAVFFSEIERVSRGRVIVSTPRGFMEQDADYGNIHEKHRSGWLPQELVDRGYTVNVYPGRMLTMILKIVDTLRLFDFKVYSTPLIVGYKDLPPKLLE